MPQEIQALLAQLDPQRQQLVMAVLSDPTSMQALVGILSGAAAGGGAPGAAVPGGQFSPPIQGAPSPAASQLPQQGLPQAAGPSVGPLERQLFGGSVG